MSVLNAVKTAIDLRLRRHSDDTLTQLRLAEACIVHLHRQGSTVQQVTVRRDHVVIDIDQPGAWITGSVYIRRVHGSVRALHKVGRVMGCQVQWVESEPNPMLQQAGA